MQTLCSHRNRTTSQLDGLGLFESGKYAGVTGTSLAGGCEIIVSGNEMSMAPQSISVVFSNSQLSFAKLGQPLTQNNAFSSNTMMGKLQYTTPSIAYLFGISADEFLLTEDYVSFEVSVIDMGMADSGATTLKCPSGSTSKCIIAMSKWYTPILFSLQPKVMYDGSEIRFYVDPKSAQDYKDDNDWFFSNAKIDNYTVDFNDFVDSTVKISGYSRNQVRGKAMGVKPNPNANPSFKFKAGYSLHDEVMMLQCSFDNQTCYKAKVVPSIQSISSNQGYTSGGQQLVIQGSGLNGQSIDVKVDGVSCSVTQSSNSQLTCSTGAQASPSADTYYIGQQGLRRSFYNDSSITISNITSYSVYQETLALSFEAPQNVQGSSSGNIFNGYFRAPATGNYRFYMSCDDVCQLYLSTANKDPSQKSLILTSYWSGYRSYFMTDGSRVSSWIPLTQGEYYYIEAVHVQGAGDDHFTVSFETDANTISGHQHSMREIQRLQIQPDNVREQSKIVFTNLDGTSYNLYFQQSAASVPAGPYTVTPTSSANTFKNAIAGYWSKLYSAPITVTKTLYDATGAVTTDSTLATSAEFLIQVERQIAQDSYVSGRAFKGTTTTSEVSFRLPKDVQKSSVPLGGSFVIDCKLLDGTTNTTLDIAANAGPWQVRDKIVQACPQYRDKIEVWDSNTAPYYSDGRDILIRFSSINADQDQLVLRDSLTTPLVTNNVPTILSTTFIPYSTNLMYEPIPFEFLFTAETSPQVIVSIDSQPAVCAGLNCGYTYNTPSALITSFSLSGTTLTINGNNLPTSTIQSITFAQNACTITSSSTTQIICTLPQIATGNWVPILIETNGQVPLDSGVSSLAIPIAISGISTTSGSRRMLADLTINSMGGQRLYISGDNFPTSDQASISITFSDGTPCQIFTKSPTLLTCLTQAYTGDTSSTSTLTVTINGVSDSSFTVSFSAPLGQITSINPSNVSPVLKSLVTLSVNSGFTGTLDINDLTVTIVSRADNTFKKLINVVSVDNTAKTITIKYGGAYSGIYDLIVTSKLNGNLDTTGITLTAKGTITSFSPTTGSVNGGTLVTINGYVFSNDPTDNAVQIGTTPCLVQTSSPSQITCRTQPRKPDSEDTEDVIVFLKTSEEAVCDAGVGQCQFTWSSSGSGALSSYSVAFNSAIGHHELTLTGSGFPSTNSDVTLIIDGVAQTITSSTSSEIKATLSGLKTGTTKDIQFYLPSGTPNGVDQLTTSGITLTPAVLSISPSVGSPAGSIITANVKGVGTQASGVTLTNSVGVSICSSVTIPSYGVVKCRTNAGAITATTLKVKVGTSSNTCSDAALCSYQTSSNMPSISTQTIQSDSKTIILVGTNFLDSGYTASVTFAGVKADSVSIDSSSQVTAIWNLGVPLTKTAGAHPVLAFESSAATHFAQTTASILINTGSITKLDSSISCSFAGGCSVSIQQAGLAASFNSESSYLKVCGLKATFDSSSSSSSGAVFKVPALATSYSVSNYKIVKETYLKGEPFSLNGNASAAFDGDNYEGFTSTANPCSFGTKFTNNHVGQLTEVKFFMNPFVVSKYAGLLQFEGSNDGTTYTNIFTVGNEIHEGWNYYSFPGAKALKYQYYRFYGAGVGACNIGEVGFRGVEVINNNSPSYACSAELVVDGGAAITLTEKVTYTSTKTPLITDISPRYGKVQGGETITFTGTNLNSDETLYSIVIDGVACTVTSATTTQVQCLTGSRPGLPETTLEMSISGQGKIATQGLLFRYVNYWSLDDTWGGEFAPVQGESVYIPKGLNLLVDVDSTPILNAVIVEGSLIFPPDDDPTHLRTFDAHYVMVKGGYFEVGTEQFPYTSKLIITMHGNRDSPELPIYGNKVIGVRFGQLELHGVPRTPTWTELEETALPGDTTIKLRTSVDWKAGETIVIAPSGYNNREAEAKVIVSVDNSVPSLPVLTLDSPLLYKHYADTETYGTDYIEMRSEVGLITRNVVYRGDPETSRDNQYGAHIMMHSSGDESIIGRIEYCEFRDVGQAFQLGRYPIHFHLIGTVHNSYVRGNAIHHTYNRAVTIHAVHYLRIIQNVAYHTMGHTYFIEDAIETKNLLQENLAVQTMASWSLLNTDQTPASFWITNPDNIFRGNHAAGSDRYGYWFDTKPNPMGPSFDPNICPENAQLGEFTNNVAHSNGRYGLRIFHKLLSRQNPCQAIQYDPTNLTDPYWKNPLITANFINFTSWKNNRNGAIAEQVADVRFINFKVADNLIGGIEFSLTKDVVDLDRPRASIIDALVIGESANSEQITNDSWVQRGIITPRTENFRVIGAKFYNFPRDYKAAIGTCSHCFHPASTDSGARTVTFSGLSFDSTVTKKIIYQYPWKDILYDLDGTLTGKGPKTWATPYYEHNNQPECSVDLDVYDGILCDSTVQVRRLSFYNFKPVSFEMMESKILKWDNSLISGLTDADKTAYILNTSAYGVIPYKAKLDPANSWTIPFVTGHKYKLHWRNGLDFTQMQVDLSSRWLSTDKNIEIMMNFTDVRAEVQMITGGDTIANGTLLTKPANQLQTGDNVVFNESIKEIHLLINGKNATRKSVLMKGNRCIGSCLGAIVDAVVEDKVRRWSDPTSWTSGKIPVAGDNVTIESGWNMLYDIAESPLLNMVEINGRLTFEDGVKDLHLKAKYVFVRAGELLIGNETTPFQKNAQITLFGEKEMQYMVYDNAIEAGNKILANTAKVSMFGKSRDKISRLLQTAQKGASSIKVEPNLDWVIGDRIGIAPTSMNYNSSDYAVITSYDSSTGIVQLDRELTYQHWGAATSTGTSYQGIDMRAEVFLLSRNIRIIGDDTDAWGCQVVTSDFIEIDATIRAGRTRLDNVEIYNCSQYDTEKAALRFEGAITAFSHVSNSAIHNGYGKGIQIQNAANILIQSSAVFTFMKYGINIVSSNNITIDGNLVFNIQIRDVIKMDGMLDIAGGVIACAADKDDVCSDIFVLNNIAGGTFFSAFVAYGHNCGDYSKPFFRNNLAHSVQGTGAVIYPQKNNDAQLDCMEGSYFSAYKVTLDAAVSYFRYREVRHSHMISIDNGMGPLPMIGQEGDNLEIKLNNLTIYGETEARDCSKENECEGQSNAAYCVDRAGLWLPAATLGGKDPMPKKASSLPIHKIKTDSSYGTKITYNKVSFIGFSSPKTYCGNTQRLIEISHYMADYQPRVKFTDTRFINIHDDNIAWIMDPIPGWANIDDCGNWPCTAPMNVLIDFENSFYSGTVKPVYEKADFQLVSNNPSAVKNFNNCKQITKWNAYHCENNNLGVLLFESMDDDKMKRMISPIYLNNYQINSTNKINTFMDHIWDGFYTGQLRMSRWPTIIQTGSTMYYEIVYSGTPPSKQRFTLNADYSGVLFKINYPKAGAYIVKDSNGNKIAANKWDDNVKNYTDIKRTKCGENRYFGVVNVLEFYMQAGCTLLIEPIDAIMTSIRLQWTLSEFYADGGTTKFADRVAASLGIHASNIKVVAVYQGSVIIDFQVTDSRGDIASKGGLPTIQNILSEKIRTKSMNLGAPILSGSVSGNTINTGSTTTTPNNTNPTVVTTVDEPKVVTNSGSGKVNVVTTNSDSQSVEEGGDANTTLIIVIIVIAVVILVGGLVTWFVYKKFRRQDHSIKVDKTKEGEANHDDDVQHSQANASPDEKLYEDQYHPKAEIGNIFGLDGEIQIDKINNADDIALEIETSHMSSIKMYNDEEQHTQNAFNQNQGDAELSERLRNEEQSPLQSNTSKTHKESKFKKKKAEVQIEHEDVFL